MDQLKGMADRGQVIEGCAGVRNIFAQDRLPRRLSALLSVKSDPTVTMMGQVVASSSALIYVR